MKLSLTVLSAAAVLATGFGLAFPAYATTGRAAVGMCIDQAGCTWAMGKDGKNIDIVTGDGHHIYCPDAKSECTVSHLTAPKGSLSPKHFATGLAAF